MTEEEKKQRRKDSKKRYMETHKEKISAYNKEYNKKRYWEHKEENREKHNAESRERYQNNKEEINRKRREAYPQEKEKILERNRGWKGKNPNYMSEYREEHKDEISDYQKYYSKTKRGRANNLLSSYRYNDKIHNRGECTLTAEWIVENIFSKSCRYCHKSDWSKLGCDRIDNSKPHTPENVVPCCDECNSKRGSTPYEEYLEKILGESNS